MNPPRTDEHAPRTPDAAPASRRRRLLVVVCVLLLAAAVRFGGLGREPLWADETLTARAASLTVREILSDASTWDHNPPLFALVMHGWVRVAGTSEAALRVPAAVFGLVTVWLVFRLARRIGSEDFAHLALVLSAIWPILVTYSQEARAYSLFACTTAFAFERFAALLDDDAGWRNPALYGLAVALCLYSHNQALFVIATHVAIAAGLALMWRGDAPLAGWALGLLAGATAYLPWVPTLVRQAGDIGTWKHWWLPEPGPVHLLWTWYTFVTHAPGYPLEARGAAWLPPGPPPPWLTVGLALLVAALCVVGLARRRSAGLRPGGALVLVLWLLLPPALAYLVSQFSTPVFLPRFQIAAVPALVLLTALGIAALGPSRRRMALAAGPVIAAQLVGLSSYHSTPAKEQWNEVGRILSEEGRPGDAVLLSEGFLTFPYLHYCRGCDLVVIEASDWDEPPSIARRLYEILPRVRRVWFVEAYSPRGSVRRAMSLLLPEGPDATYSPRGISLTRYDLVTPSRQ